MDAIGNDLARALDWYGRGTSILMDIARGLHFLHSNRVAHRCGGNGLEVHAGFSLYELYSCCLYDQEAVASPKGGSTQL